MKRDCQCKRVRHEHGTPGAYTADGCRCPDCREAHRQYSANRRRLIAYGQWDRGHVPDIGSRRRVEALMTQGWSMKTLSGRLGMSHYGLERMLRNPGGMMHPKTAARVAALYDELWDKKPPTGTWGQNVSYAKAIAHAKRRGFAAPLMWDDDSIEDPDAEPQNPGNTGWEHKECGTEAAYRRHVRNKEPIDQACRNANSLAAALRKGAA